MFPCLDLDLEFMRACGVGSLLTARINFSLSMNLLSLSQGVVLKMGVPLQASAGVGVPGAPQNSACGWLEGLNIHHSPLVGSAALMWN